MPSIPRVDIPGRLLQGRVEIGLVGQNFIDREPSEIRVLLVVHVDALGLAGLQREREDDGEVAGAIFDGRLLATSPVVRVVPEHAESRGLHDELLLALHQARHGLLGRLARLHAAPHEPPIRLRLHDALAQQDLTIRPV